MAGWKCIAQCWRRMEASSSSRWVALAYAWRARHDRYSRTSLGWARQLWLQVFLSYCHHLATSRCAPATLAVPAAKGAVRVTAAVTRRIVRSLAIRILTPAGSGRVIGPGARRGRSWVLDHLLCVLDDRPVVPAPRVRNEPGAHATRRAPPGISGRTARRQRGTVAVDMTNPQT